MALKPVCNLVLETKDPDYIVEPMEHPPQALPGLDYHMTSVEQ